MFVNERHPTIEPADAAMISYSLLRHLGFMLDELSAQGLRVWQNTNERWCWAWAETSYHSERGFWSIGEAIVDAVVMRFPAAFGTQEREEQPAA